MTHLEKDQLLMAFQPVKITIEFSGVILGADIPNEAKRIYEYFNKGVLDQTDLDSLCNSMGEYTIESYSADMEKGIEVIIRGNANLNVL